MNAFDMTDVDPCLGEAFVRKADAGAVSFIGNTRSGFGVRGFYEHGASFKFNREFYHHLFTTDWSGYWAFHNHLGAVYNRMKSYWIGECEDYGTMSN